MFSFFKKSKVITRIAPSPTGYFHIGGVRTALFNYLFTRQNKGKFILRIDDTDEERNEEKYEKNIFEVFKWLGLDYDETFKQSERKEIYKKHLKKLISNEAAYEAEKSKTGEGSVIRFKNPNTKIKFKDIILGEVEFDTGDLEDFVIAKNINSPVYHFTSVVDDGESGITHIIRGQEHLANTPRQILILEALGFILPEYAHIPLIMSPRGGKLSKRDPEVIPALDYKEQGILPEALINFLAFIGWNPGGEKEIYSISELIKVFDLTKVQKGGGIFNIEKLYWINKQYIKKMDELEFLAYIENKIKDLKKLPNYTDDKLKKLVPVIRERIENYKDLKKMISDGELDYFFEKPKLDLKKISWKDNNIEITKKLLQESATILNNLDKNEFHYDLLKKSLWALAEEKGKGSVLWPIRYALSGKERSPDPFAIMEILGKDESISRTEYAIQKL